MNNRQKDEENDENVWENKCKQLTEKLANLEHEQKKVNIELRTDLEFERKRADEFEEKYKGAIRYKNEEEELKKIMNDLSEKLKSKENQILEYMKADQEKKRKIGELDQLNQQISRERDLIKLQLQQIQQGAISAILEKDSIITDLQQKIVELESVDSHGLQSIIIELEDKYRELEDKAEAEKRDLEELVESKQDEIKEICDKFNVQRERYEQKITILEQQTITLEKHIQKINEERNDQENLEERCYLLEEKQRKTEKKLHDSEISFKLEKQQLMDSLQNLQNELQTVKGQGQELKNANNKIKQLEKQLKNRKKDIEENKANFQKIKGDYLKKITQLQTQKKKMQDTLDIRSQELQRLRGQLEEKTVFDQNKQQQKTPEKDGSSLAIDLETMSGKKNLNKRQSSVEDTATIQKLRGNISDLEQHIEKLSLQLEESTKETQSLRQQLVSKSGSAGMSEGQASLLVQIEDLNSYIKKVQHNLMISKLKAAEDESYFSSRQSDLKKQVQRVEKKSKKEKLQLLQRIDRMKKSTSGKDKKVDYYQSSLK